MKFGKKKQRSSCDPEVDCENKSELTISIPSDERVEDFLIQTRRLLLVGEIDEAVSTYVCSYLQLLSLKKDPIYIYINSLGGCLASGYAIIDQMLACRCPIYTIVRGHGHSMAAIIAAFGDKGHRYAMPNSTLMLHSIILQIPPESIERHTKITRYIEEDYERKISTLARRMKVTKKQLIEIMDQTRWMSPKQAIEIGLIDNIWTPRMEQEL